MSLVILIGYNKFCKIWLPMQSSSVLRVAKERSLLPSIPLPARMTSMVDCSGLPWLTTELACPSPVCNYFIYLLFDSIFSNCNIYRYTKIIFAFFAM